MIAEASTRAATEAVTQYIATMGENAPNAIPAPTPPVVLHVAPPPIQNQISVSSSTSDPRSRVQLSTNHRGAQPRQQRQRSPPRRNASPPRVPLFNEGEGEVNSRMSRQNLFSQPNNQMDERMPPPTRRNPFTIDILNEVLPQGVKISGLPQFEGTTNPQEHIEKFSAMADLYGPTDAAMAQDMLSGIMQQNLKPGRFKESIAGRPPGNLEELLNRAEKYVRIEEASTHAPPKRKREDDRQDNRRRDDRRPPLSPQGQPSSSYNRFTPLNARLTEILHDRRHTTEECAQLKAAIEKLIKQGHLGEYIDKPRNKCRDDPPRRDNNRDQQQRREDGGHRRDPDNNDNQPTRGIISFISGGPAGGDSQNARRTLARSARMSQERASPSARIYQIRRPDHSIVFNSSDLEGPDENHVDALVVTTTMANFLVKKIIVDGGSSADIMYLHVFKQLGIDNARFSPISTPLKGFTGESILSMGEVELPVSLGKDPCRITKLIKFLVVDKPSPYNIILGRPTIHTFKSVPSSYHQKWKFPTPYGMGEVLGDRRLARECYARALREPSKKPKPSGRGDDTQKSDKRKWVNVIIEDNKEILISVPDDSIKLAAVEELKLIELTPGDTSKLIRIGSDLDPTTERQLINFLRHNGDVFAWKAQDLSGIPPQVALHRLNVDKRLKPVKQRKRTFGPERNKHIKAEVAKLLEAGHIRPLQYPEWLSNVVLVPKPGGKWRLCVDFTDLNKACPKDPFPLPRIDQLIDSTSGCELLCFLDAYQGYNQILLAPEDQERASFITDQCIYCYQVMPFGLRNAGATYQRLVNKMFADQIGKNMEVYIDDMLVKSVKVSDHLTDRDQCFAILRKYKMKLNPLKCSFRVRGGKFLGYMISQRGIEANPARIEAITSMAPPTSINEVQQLNGCLASLNRFISRSADKALPFFKILRGGKKFEWDEACQKAVTELKSYLASPPLLTKHQPGDTLMLYLATSVDAISAVLIRDGGKGYQPIYYISRSIQGSEQRYTNMEKLALSLINAARKLRPYFQSHQVVVLTNYPLKQILRSPETSGRLAKWAIELSEYGVEFKPRPAIKAKVLADFLVEMTSVEESTSLPTWTVNVDGSSTATGGGAGIVLTNPDGDEFEYAQRFEFTASNNVAEYEALLAGIRLALAAGARKLLIKSNSQLVVNQVLGVYEAKEDTMAKYLALAHTLLSKFESYEIRQVPRSNNIHADKLARLGSSMASIGSRKVTLFTSPQPEINSPIEVQYTEEDEPCWFTLILKYLKKGELPTDPTEARKLKTRAARFVIVGEELYKRGFSFPYLKCLDPTTADYVLREVHEGICGNHLSGRTLALKLLRQGYYWPTMHKDAKRLVRRCKPCQKHANIPHLPAALMQPIDSPIPFAQWGMDLVGPFPPATGGRKYLIVAVDYFTKWLEAESLARIREEEVIQFLWKNIVCRLGIPSSIISDNGTQFCGDKVKNWCLGLDIKQFFTSVANPQANGQTKVTNRTILQHLKTRLGSAKGKWVEELPNALWAYRTTPRAATGESPFNLAFGTEAITPVEIGEPSWRITNYDPAANEEAMRGSLDLVDELREIAYIRQQMYKSRMAKAYNSKVRPRSFQVGDLVLRKAEASHPIGKLDPKWEGPYKITKVVNTGAYRLENINGHPIPRTWNIGNLKRFYAKGSTTFHVTRLVENLLREDVYESINGTKIEDTPYHIAKGIGTPKEINLPSAQ
ncbi:PREDICTED: uncharacterized protein LOC105954870 [Erythranthe guttata]|uniref:uncharacterized protein LOC105954870 n=1 Tax=Erythranthe guttata TaxID=4155 RepID=UPI00064DA2F4|nr:PREDICTED: uncharacterized protein LOC105954870 [Erythranthe guttata]|eukprot:XP_012834007.1 PREDICTED: uncharacterized protein LOC105954870 [Erythranthe guttata]